MVITMVDECYRYHSSYTIHQPWWIPCLATACTKVYILHARGQLHHLSRASAAQPLADCGNG